MLHGADFSGAADAGRKIWIASGVPEGGRLHIAACRPALALPGGGPQRAAALKALRDFIAQAGDAAFGLDFPFAIPQALMGVARWADFALAFAERYPNARAFREACLAAADGRELRRGVAAAREAPFASYNWRLYRQTYHGIRDVLAPLVAADRVCVLPMQEPLPGRPWLLEVCPAVTLKRLGLYKRYKGRTAEHQAARAAILAGLVAQGVVVAEELRPAILGDAGGDALDAVVAALATWRAARDPNAGRPAGSPSYRLEGHIYG